MNTVGMIEQRSKETEIEAIRLLNSKGKCALVRPTGFGKTVIMCRIAHRYERVLYVYPSEVVKRAAISHLKDKEVTFWSYRLLGEFHNNIQLLFEQVLGKYDLIIFDEIHHMGANNVKEVVSKLLSILDTNKTHIIGGTATPKRMDGYDVIDSFFDSCVTSAYGLNDMIEDGLIPEPYYVCALQGYEVILEELKKTLNKLNMSSMLSEIKKKELEVDIRKRESQVSYTMNAPIIIKKAVDEVYSGVTPQYMRFSVFFSTKEILDRKSKEVEQWFKTIYGEYDIHTLTIYSKAIEKKNVTKLVEMKQVPNRIDLVFSINMLNEGYHIEDNTGCILLRPTKSQTVYKQQVGRSMQAGMEQRPIIIDLVENLNTEALFGVDVAPLNTSKVDSDITAQLNSLDYIKPKNIHIIDKVAEVKEVIRRLNDSLYDTLENKVIDLRINNHMPAGTIADMLKVNAWEVFQILHRYEDKLSESRHQLQERDVYKFGSRVEEKPEPDFQEYLKILTGA